MRVTTRCRREAKLRRRSVNGTLGEIARILAHDVAHIRNNEV
jgi:hypothetical protein